MGPVIAEFQGRRLAPKIRGIDVEREEKVTQIREVIKEGKLDLEMDEKGNSNKCVIGKDLANELGVIVGDKITVYSPGNLSSIIDEINKAKGNAKGAKSLDQLQQMILPADLTVTGIFASGRYAFDAEFILVPLNIGQELYSLGDDVHGLSVRVEDPYQSEEVKRGLEKVLPPQLNVMTWIDMNKQFFDAVRIERNTMFVLLMIIVVVASFGIMNTLITVTVQKTREIGIMKALGAKTSQILWVFLAQGMVVGLFGNVSGLAVGMMLIRWRNEFKEWLASALHIEIFPPGIYQFSAIPAEVVPHDVVVICVSAFVICSLAALIPAFAAARLDPVKALRYE
jgi:lipoprotein-releasing system permease protein